MDTMQILAPSESIPVSAIVGN